MLKIAYAPVYKYSLPNGHRFPMEKYEILPEQLLYEGSIQREQFFHPDRLTEAEILKTHTPEYLDKLFQQKLTAKEVRRIGFPMTEALVERGRYISMATYQCSLYAMEYGISMNIAGGTHHAFADHGEGFCILNDVAIASNLLLEGDPNMKILILDLDVHQGNGTAHIFQNNKSVFTCSMHGRNNYPYQKEVSDYDIELDKGIGDDEYLRSLAELLDSLSEIFRPDIIFYIAGVDVLGIDRLGTLNLTRNGAKERDRMVIDYAQRHGIPLVVVMGGGYAVSLAAIVDAHANTYRVAMDYMS
ncbi:histone deacetylase family protein [Membranihabitans marinus]|uniref:histone deacetylase family protein n=1 Tax=Membranihabitans marinus TaxID=1227546 RepID=UPI001F353B69|nr:histone deacetylase [Membranihabitans marinus]